MWQWKNYRSSLSPEHGYEKIHKEYVGHEHINHGYNEAENNSGRLGTHAALFLAVELIQVVENANVAINWPVGKVE